jgi:hypothetical protein
MFIMIGYNADRLTAKIAPVATKRGAPVLVASGALAALLAVSGPAPWRNGFSEPAVAATTAQQQAQQAQQAKARRVTAELTNFLRGKVTSRSGKLQLQIKPGARADLGQFAEIFMSGRGVQVKKKLQVTEFTMRARNVQISVAHLLRNQDKELHTFRSATSLRAVITENDLTTSLARGKRSGSMGLRVKYLGDRLFVSGNWQMGWLNGPVEGTGRLRLAPDHKVYFDIISMKLNGAEVPVFIKNRFSQNINPLIDSDDLPFMPRFRSLRIQGTQAILTS